MKTITIGGEEYTLRYSIKAMLEKDCADAVSRYSMNFATIDSVESFAKAYSEVVALCLIALHAGLLEKHNLSMEECETLLDAYFDEHADDGQGDAMSLMNFLMEVMQEDGFFRKTGLEKILNLAQNPEETEAKKTPKAPQDHKRKQAKQKVEKIQTAEVSEK